MNAADLELCFPFPFCELEKGHRRLNKATKKQLLFSDVSQWSILLQGQNHLSFFVYFLASEFFSPKAAVGANSLEEEEKMRSISQKQSLAASCFVLGCSEINKSHPKQGFSSFETLC